MNTEIKNYSYSRIEVSKADLRPWQKHEEEGKKIHFTKDEETKILFVSFQKGDEFNKTKTILVENGDYYVYPLADNQNEIVIGDYTIPIE